MRRRGRVKKILAAATLAAGCCFAYGGAWTDPDSKLIWSYDHEGGSDGLVLTGLSGTCPEDLVIPSDIPIVQMVGNEAVTNAYFVEGLQGVCKNRTNVKSVVIPPMVASLTNGTFAGCTSLESVRFLGPVPTGLDFGLTFAGTPYLAGLEAANDNDYLFTPVSTEYVDAAREISGASGTARDNNVLATPNEPGGDDGVVDPVKDFDPLRGYAGWLVGSKWYKWTAPASTTVWFDTKGSDFNTVLGVYIVDSYSPDHDQVAYIYCGENTGFIGKTSLVSFELMQGRTYHICVGGSLENDKSHPRGNIVLNWRTGTAVTLTLMTPSTKKATQFIRYMKIPVPKGKPVEVLPEPTREGYSFAGWYTKKAGGTKVTASTRFAKATTLYARWTIRKYRVTLLPGEGCASLSGQGLHPHGSSVTISAAALPGYKFRGWEVSEPFPSGTAFTNYKSLWRKNQTAKIKIPAGNVAYTATFVKEDEDFLSLTVGGASAVAAPGAGPWYAEQTPSLAVPVMADSQTYPTVTTSKLPSGTAFKLANSDCEYVFSVPSTAKLPPGRTIVKVTAKNRWGMTTNASLVVFGKNKTAANAWLGGIETSALAPYPMTVGVTPSFADLGIVPVKDCTITKMTGLPAGLSWDAKKKAFTGYPTRVGTFTVTITASMKVGKRVTNKVSTITVEVTPLPDGLAGTYYGSTRPVQDDDSYQLCRDSLPVTLTVSTTGKLTAKVDTSTFSGGGVKKLPDATGDRYEAKFHKKTSTRVGKKTRSVEEWLTLTINPQADIFGSAFALEDSWYSRQDVFAGSLAISPDTRVAGRLNKFGKGADGLPKDARWNTIAFLAAERGEMEFTAYVDEGAGQNPVPAELKVWVNGETGVATLAGTLGGTALEGTAVLSPEADPDTVGAVANAAFARFFIGKYVIEVKWLLHPGPAAGDIGGIGDPSGRGWRK